LDLHVVGSLASPAERAAVDAVLDLHIGPAGSWTGGERQIGTEGHVSRGGHEARARRDLLLPALHALQSRMGWISQAGLNHICKRLTVPPAEAYGVATFYHLFSTVSRPQGVAHICDDIACREAGGEDLCAEMESRFGPDGEAWSRSPCLGLCERAPAALVTVAGAEPRRTALAPADGDTLSAILAGPTDVPDDVASSVPQVGQPDLALLRRVGNVDPTSIDDYREAGGYVALQRALERGPDAVIDDVTRAGLLGRGGAAFPTGRKWAAVASQAAQPHYVVCNADESEPGTFKDRVLLEQDPFAIVEAMTIEAFAVGANHGYIYIRGEYPLAEERVHDAIEAAREAGLLGADILGRGFDFELEIRRGAGAYICGEETALFASIEGHRGEPRNKPPYPVEVGLFGKPTAVNNVETLANVLLIMEREDGAEAFAAIGTDGSSGPKLFCVSGSVARPGVYEVPFGTTLGQLIGQAGGVSDDAQPRAILLGGAAGSFVGPEMMDTPLTFEGTRAIGASLGSGVVMVFDQDADMVGTLGRIAAFFRDESCGQCVPCRVGTVRQEEALSRLADATPEDAQAELVLLRDVGMAMRDASICGLGQTASSAIESALRQPELMAP
jgi:NADH-quinone oxidoreductase subunit F